jgi:KDO2-lipid IV(A) lauroyltransferase
MGKKNSASDSNALFDKTVALVYLSGIYMMIFITNLIGLKNTLCLGKLSGSILYVFSSRTRNKILHNLGLAYDNLIPSKEKNRLAKKVLQNLGKNWAELIFCAGPFKKRSWKNISVEGIENLDAALKSGKGVIAVSAHIGNYALIGTILSSLGYDFCTVVRDLKTKAGSIAYHKSRRLIELPSIPTFPEQQFYKNALKILRRNGALCLISDENKRHGGIFVDFFSRKASTAPGPAGLALRTGAKIIPVFMIRNSDASQKIVIEKEINWEKRDDPEKDTANITAAFTSLIESYVRKYPEQWLWTNFRWRTQPEGQSDGAKIKKKINFKNLKKKIKKAF